ncbi:MAG TPA: hypothetical protein VNV85_11520 [Puia sp.]|nr:hypothetical protein [Puia sp.]
MKFFCTATLFCLLFIHSRSYGQVTDSSKKSGIQNNNIFRLVMNSMTRSHGDSAAKAIKSADQFKPYQGKGIRHIYITKFGFDKLFTDTSNRLNYFGTRLLNHLHRDSRDWVLRDNLFIKEHTALDPYKLADNERFLRTLNFIQDARIEIVPVYGESDSVDVIVITKDLFSISGQIAGASNTNFKVQASESNFLGMAQRIEGTALFETTRSPAFGYELSYSKSSIANSFINASVIYTTINPNLAGGSPNETAWFIRLDRPLVSEFMHFAGGITVGENESFNAYAVADSTFYKYHYNTYDAWVGYALGANKSFKVNTRDRKFLSVRYLQNQFLSTPYQIADNFNFKFNDRQAVLAQLTLFKQDFFKTNYIYGFGTTEDIPHGYNISFTTGWYRQLYLKRFYGGTEFNKYVASSQGDFLQYYLQTGAFISGNQLQDASVLLGASVYSRLFLIGNTKLRQYGSFSYTRLFNNIAIDPLRIDNPFGLRYFSSDSTIGQQRISLHEETFIFLKYKLFGFKFAPFAFADAALLTPPKQDFSKSQAYYGIGCGVRTRNENLVFGTIEVRLVYFPNTVPQNNTFKILTTINLQFRYNATYVHAPDIAQLNTDPTNNIY